jgi:gliding motility-associated lipoprotein GldJ
MYPVVGISWYQAHEFCKWRTYVVNSKMKEDDPEAITYPKYRLPTEAEWEYAARGLLEQQLYPWEGKSLRNLDGRFRANFKRGRGDFAGRSDKGGSELTGGLNDAYMITAPVRAEFQPNDFGLYHMAGNVAEWTEDTYRVLAYEDVQDLNPFRRRGQTQDPWKEDSQYPTNESGDLSLLYNPGTDNDPGAGSGNAEQHNRVKVYRGGSWNDVAYYLSCGSRRYLNADSSLATVGFRCAMTRVGSPELD